MGDVIHDRSPTVAVCPAVDRQAQHSHISGDGLDFEEFSQRTLPQAPQARFKGHTLPLQERVRVLRLALCTVQKLVTSGSLHPTKVITRATSLVPLGGPTQAGLNRRPCFTRKHAMMKHIAWLSQSRGGGRARSLYVTPPQPPPPPGFESGLGAWRQRRPLFFAWRQRCPPFFSVCFLFIRPSVLLSARYRKTRRYTNVVCCEVLSAEMSKTGRYSNVVCC